VIRDLMLLPGPPHTGWPLDPALWSLTVEAQFYLVAPLLFTMLASRTFAVMFFVVSVVWWLGYAAGIGGPYLPVWLCLFIAGSLYARTPVPDIAMRLAPVCFGLIVVAGIIFTIFPVSKEAARPLTILVSVLIAPYVAASVGRKSGRGDRATGNLAYPLYVIHMPVIDALVAIGMQAGLTIKISTSLAAAVALFCLIDLPLERLRRNFVRRCGAKPAALEPYPTLRPDLKP